MTVPADAVDQDPGTGGQQHAGEDNVLRFPQRTPPPPPPLSMAALRADHESRRAAVVEGRPEAVARQRSLGKLTARERLALLLDPDSFTELDLHRRAAAGGAMTSRSAGAYTDGVVAGSGTVDGRRVFVYAQDFTVMGGSLGRTHAAKIHKVMDLALATGCPVIALNDSGGARIQEGVLALHGCGEIFRRQVAASGIVPQISVVLGPCAGAAAYSPALADVVFMVRDVAQMYLTGPDVVQTVTGERVSHEELGGAGVHGPRSGVATIVVDDERECLDRVRHLLSLLPSNNLDPAPSGPPCGAADDVRPRLADLVPADARRPYDVRDVIAELLDDEEPVEFHREWAGNVVCVLGRIDGRVVGVVGNQPLVLAGVLDRHASQKAARFVRFCDTFGIPLVTLVDVPGFLPGRDQEEAGIIRHGAQLLYAYCEATVPRVQVVLRKAYGGAYIVMDSRSIGTDLSFAWPTNEIAVMGPEAAVNVLHRRALAGAPDPAALRARLASEYRDEYLDPRYAAEHGLVDDVIDPADTRVAIARGLQLLCSKRTERRPRKHGNIPL
ncbi:acyl-CoA carboxylase subunit beta [Geodermatophilus maliterrae]|uniref:Acyl-CoA carboxylase subunit beta n=1 Tax=Geodermatophilus maliterrae TaxID=3162531 RepID=A0ABV3XA29_9ACTN